MHLLITVALALAIAGAAHADEAIDGDTLEIQGERIRLFGVDAFELQQTCLDPRGEPWRCGVAARAALAELVQDQAIGCTVVAEQDGQGYVGRCTARDDVDLGGYMVMAGLALADREQPEAYGEEEAAARAAGAGAWGGIFASPWDWRQGSSDE